MTAWDAQGEWVGSQVGGGSQPTLSVDSDVGSGAETLVDGGAYPVAAGARSLTIDEEDGATLLTTVKLGSDGSSITVTDSDTDAPSWTNPSGGTSGESVQVTVVATLNGRTQQHSHTELIEGSGGGGEGGWSTPTNHDYASDNDTTVTITEGGGDTQLYAADGTTEKGVVRLANRGGSPTTTATVDADGISAQSVRTGNNQSAYLAWVMSDSDLDFTAFEQFQAVDIVVKDMVFADDDDQVNIYLGDNPSPVSGNGSMIQIRRISGATEYRLRRLASSALTDTSFTSGVGAITSIAVRWLFFRGTPFVMLFQLNATSPIAATKGNGSTILECWRGGSIASLNDPNPELITTPWYVGFDMGPRGSSGQVDGTVTDVVCNQLDTTP